MEKRMHWTDDRIDQKMAAIDATFERISTELAEIRAEIRGLRGDIAVLQDRMTQIGFGLAAVLFVQMTAVTIAVIVALSR